MRAIKSALVFLAAASLIAGCQTCLCGTSAPPATNITPAALFTDNMVLQRGMDIPVWGWAVPGGRVTVAMGGRKARAIAGDDGKWQVRLKPLQAGGPYEMAITGAKTITLTNVMIGDVWIASGQSNMQWPVMQGNWGVRDREREVAEAGYPNIRLFQVPRETAFEPRENIETEGWVECSPETVPGFSAVAYFFGRHIHLNLDVPVGLIQSAWGGTVAEAWTSEPTLETMPDFKAKLDQLTEQLPRADQIAQEYEQKMAEWRAGLDQHDAGSRDGQPVWCDPLLDTSDWAPIEVPKNWEDAGWPTLDGFGWYRRAVEVPASWAGKDLVLHLGPINDADRAWFNGTQVADFTGSWRTPRAYPVPGALVKPGQNVITVRVFDMGNRGGICGEPNQLRLELAQADGANPLSLAGSWQFKVGLDMKGDWPQPPQPLLIKGNPNLPGVLYNAMIAPLLPYGIAGAIWYQGESNAGRAYQYRKLFPAMIQDWRAAWGQGEFPFLFVQLANFLEVKPDPGEDEWAELREAQLMALSLPNTGMAVTIDIGEAEDIHPQNKQDVGRRLGLAAQRVAYGEDLVYSGPIYAGMEVDGGAIRLQFDHIGGGLVAKGGPPTGFAIAGADKRFVWAVARIDGDTVVVSSPDVPKPVAVRYAWAINPVCNLYNAEGLPTSPFRTDDWPGLTVGNK